MIVRKLRSWLRRLITLLRRLLSFLRGLRRPRGTLRAVPPRYFRRHVAGAGLETRRQRKRRSRIIRLAQKKGVG